MSPFRQGQEPHSLHGKGIFSSGLGRVGRALSAVGLEGLPLTGLFVIGTQSACCSSCLGSAGAASLC